MDSITTKIMIVCGLVALTATILGLANYALGAVLNSPNGSFRDHLDSWLNLIAGLFVAICLIVGGLAMAKELWPG